MTGTSSKSLPSQNLDWWKWDMKWQNGDKSDKMLPPAIKNNYLCYLPEKKINPNWFSVQTKKPLWMPPVQCFH